MLTVDLLPCDVPRTASIEPWLKSLKTTTITEDDEGKQAADAQKLEELVGEVLLTCQPVMQASIDEQVNQAATRA